MLNGYYILMFTLDTVTLLDIHYRPSNLCYIPDQCMDGYGESCLWSQHLEEGGNMIGSSRLSSSGNMENVTSFWDQAGYRKPCLNTEQSKCIFSQPIKTICANRLTSHQTAAGETGCLYQNAHGTQCLNISKSRSKQKVECTLHSLSLLSQRGL